MHDDIDGLLHDVYREVAEEVPNTEENRNGPSEDAKKFYKLVEEGQEEFYPGCTRFSKLSFTIDMYIHKCVHRMSNEAFDDLLNLLKEAFPSAKLPESCNQAKKMVKDLGPDYQKIHPCLNGNDKERLLNRPKGIPEDQFKRFTPLVKSTRKWQKRSQRCQKRQDNMHTTGRTSFAVIKHKLQESKEGKEPPTRAELFVETRKRGASRAYKKSYLDTQQKIARMVDLQTQPFQENSFVDPFTSVMPNEHSGRVRLEGRAVTKKNLKDIASSSSTSLNGIHVKVPTDLVKSITASVTEKVERDLVSKFFLKLQAVLPNLDREALAGLMCQKMLQLVLEMVLQS